MLQPSMNMGLNHSSSSSSSICCCALLVLLLCLATCHTEAEETLLHHSRSTSAPSRHAILQSHIRAAEPHPLRKRRLQDATSTATYFIGPSRFTSALAISKGSATPVGSPAGSGGGGGGGSGAAAPARSGKLVRTGQAVPKTSYSLNAEVAKDVLEVRGQAGVRVKCEVLRCSVVLCGLGALLCDALDVFRYNQAQ
jgi:hypothetical protein